MESSLLLHLYGLSNGIYLSAFVYLCFFALSYLLFNQQKKVALNLFLSALGFGAFGLYNIFAQQVHGAITTQVFSPKFFLICKFSAPIALMITGHIYMQIVHVNNFRTYRVLHKSKPLLKCVYVINVVCFVALFFIKNNQEALLLIHSSMLFCILVALILTYMTIDYIKLGKLTFVIFIICLINVLYVMWQLSTDNFVMSPVSFLLTHLGFGFVILLFSFASIRANASEAHRMAFITDTKQQKLVYQLHHAINNNELHMVYQPKINASDDGLMGFESLVRWEHAQEGYISPHLIVSIAEKTGMIDMLCLWVIETVVKQAKRLEQKGLDTPISINFSTANLKPNIVTFLSETMDNYDLSRHMIAIEITETVVLELDDNKLKALNMLQCMNIPLSLDDYGTGFSSLSYINKLSLKELKIDKSFIFDLDSKQENRVIVSSILQMSEGLNLKVVAEGVETPEVKNILTQLGCNILQGYLISKPMTAYDLIYWIDDYNKNQSQKRQKLLYDSI